MLKEKGELQKRLILTGVRGPFGTGFTGSWERVKNTKIWRKPSLNFDNSQKMHNSGTRQFQFLTEPLLFSNRLVARQAHKTSMVSNLARLSKVCAYQSSDLYNYLPEVMSCILIGNCSRWFAQAFNFCTKSWNLPATSRSGVGSNSEKKN